MLVYKLATFRIPLARSSTRWGYSGSVASSRSCELIVHFRFSVSNVSCVPAPSLLGGGRIGELGADMAGKRVNPFCAVEAFI